MSPSQILRRFNEMRAFFSSLNIYWASTICQGLDLHIKEHQFLLSRPLRLHSPKGTWRDSGRFKAFQLWETFLLQKQQFLPQFVLIPCPRPRDKLCFNEYLVNHKTLQKIFFFFKLEKKITIVSSIEHFWGSLFRLFYTPSISHLVTIILYVEFWILPLSLNRSMLCILSNLQLTFLILCGYI